MNTLINATVLSNFAAAGCLDLLRDAVGPLHLPTDVYDEVLAGQMAGYSFYDDIERHIAPFVPEGWLHLVTPTDQEVQLLPSLPARLHRGEAACLCIARQRGWGFLTDDRAARRQARAWNIVFSGTVGILLLAVQEDRLPVLVGNALLQRMIDLAHYRSPVNDLRLLLP